MKSGILAVPVYSTMFQQLTDVVHAVVLDGSYTSRGALASANGNDF